MTSQHVACNASKGFKDISSVFRCLTFDFNTPKAFSFGWIEVWRVKRQKKVLELLRVCHIIAVCGHSDVQRRYRGAKHCWGWDMGSSMGAE